VRRRDSGATRWRPSGSTTDEPNRFLPGGRRRADVAHRILVPFELPDHEPAPDAVVAALGAMDVVVLGHFGLPEQTPAAAGRDQFEASARAELEEIAGELAAAGASVTTRLVFGKERAKTVDRVAVEEECDVVLTPGEVESVDRVLVPLRGEDALETTIPFVAELVAATGASVTLFHAAAASDRRPGEAILDDAAERLTAEGVAPDRIDRLLADDGEDPRTAIVAAGETVDVIVLGESEPSVRERVLGALSAVVTAETTDPTFVVRNG
jgi:nucleotide-binding universal stress UspA family protein